MDRTNRLCAMGWALTKPLAGASSSSVIRASASRRSAAASEAPNWPHGATRGAGPYGCGRVMWIEPSFLGYPWCRPRAIAKSESTQMYTQRLKVSPR
jgi:hypothetical protein